MNYARHLVDATENLRKARESLTRAAEKAPTQAHRASAVYYQTEIHQLLNGDGVGTGSGLVDLADEALAAHKAATRR